MINQIQDLAIVTRAFVTCDVKQERIRLFRLIPVCHVSRQLRLCTSQVPPVLGHPDSSLSSGSTTALLKNLNSLCDRKLIFIYISDHAQPEEKYFERNIFH